MLPAAPLPGPSEAARAEVLQAGGPVGVGDGGGLAVAGGGAVTVTVVVTVGPADGAAADPQPVRKPATASRMMRVPACRAAMRVDFSMRAPSRESRLPVIHARRLW